MICRSARLSILREPKVWLEKVRPKHALDMVSLTEYLDVLQMALPAMMSGQGEYHLDNHPISTAIVPENPDFGYF